MQLNMLMPPVFCVIKSGYILLSNKVYFLIIVYTRPSDSPLIIVPVQIVTVEFLASIYPYQKLSLLLLST